MSGTLMPGPWFTGLDDNGNPISSGKLYVYDAGTETDAAVYHDADLSAQWSQPVTLDGAGRAVVFLVPGRSYKFRLKTSAGVLVKEQDDVDAVPNTAGAIDALGTAGEALAAGDACYLSDGSGGKTAGRWYKAKADNSYSSSLPVIGFAATAIAAGALGSLRLAGDLTMLTPLTPGSYYYVDPTTAGAITTVQPTAPNSSRPVGQASSTTVLVVTANPPAPTVSWVNANNILANQVFS